MGIINKMAVRYQLLHLVPTDEELKRACTLEQIAVLVRRAMNVYRTLKNDKNVAEQAEKSVEALLSLLAREMKNITQATRIHYPIFTNNQGDEEKNRQALEKYIQWFEDFFECGSGVWDEQFKNEPDDGSCNNHNVIWTVRNAVEDTTPISSYHEVKVEGKYLGTMLFRYKMGTMATYAMAYRIREMAKNIGNGNVSDWEALVAAIDAEFPKYKLGEKVSTMNF